MSAFVEPSLLVPALQKDLSVRALETVGARVADLNIESVVIYNFDTVPAVALPHLAQQLNLVGNAGWSLADTETKKRALLKEAVALHKIKGTRFAVERVLNLLGVHAEIKEWWQQSPQAEAHTFSVTLGLVGGTAVITEARARKIKPVIDFWKPVRAHLSAARVSINVRAASRLAAIARPIQYVRLLSLGGAG